MSAPRTIAALYVATDGAYFGLPGIEPWDATRDARTYAGPWPVVAHPPCERWGRFATGNFNAPRSRTLGDDGGCFAAALASVRAWGGVLEHPAGSRAWDAYDLPAPPASGGWVRGLCGGWACQVAQGWYGHAAQKPTWLYVFGCDLPALRWGPSPETWRDDPTRSERWRARAEKDGVCVLLSRKQRAATPVAFRDLLVSIARTAHVNARKGAA